MDKYISHNCHATSQFIALISLLNSNSLHPIDAKSCAAAGVKLDPNISLEKIVDTLKLPVVISDATEKGRLVILQHPEGYVVLDAAEHRPSLMVIHRGFKAEKLLQELQAKIAGFIIKNDRDDGVWVDFVHFKEGHSGGVREFIHCPSWTDISKNYPESVREKLAFLHDLQKPWESGRLLLWWGPPGTGKTYAIRSLMMAWREEFDLVVVTDPEKLAAMPEYYFSIASSTRNDPEDFSISIEAKRKRKLFILEDSADLILTESRHEHYDKVGKLLNMTDGLFGQGRNDIFIITFNEEVRDIDPAFLRPGRCIGTIEFEMFDIDGATRWFAEHKSEEKADKEMSLADMYSLLIGRQHDVSQPSHSQISLTSKLKTIHTKR
jgi:hypothetical protein